LSHDVDLSIFTDVGSERGIASTKTFTANVLMILLFAMAVNDCDSPMRREIISSLKNLQDILQQAFGSTKKIEKISDSLRRQQNIMICGRGSNYAIAREASMKLSSVARVNCTSYHGGELKHGPIALIEKGQQLIFLATISSDQRIETYRAALGQIAARGGYPIILTDGKNKQALRVFAEHIISVPQVIDCLQPIINVIPMQLLGFFIATMKGLQPDNPQNLAKCATIK